jgi:hypothetical protein
METPIGTCSECGGPVVVPDHDAWNPTPHCAHCGAVARNPYGPRVEMEPGSPRERTRGGEKETGTTDVLPWRWWEG